MKTRTIALATALFCAAIGSAQVTKQGNAYLLRMKYTKGMKMVYSMNNTANLPAGMGPGGPMVMTAPMSMTVKDFAGGIATIAYSVGPMTMNGKSNGKPTTGTIKQDTRGKVISGDKKAVGVSSMTFPEKAIKVGESWTAETTSPGMGGEMKMLTTFTLSGMKAINGKQVAVLAVKMVSAKGASAQPGMNVTGKGTMTMLMSDCSLFSADIATTILMGEKSTPITASTKIVRK